MKTLDAKAEEELRKLVYILPLRNENNVIKQESSYSILCLYPTFKEWKPNWKGWKFKRCHRLYPTFKEWKLKNWYHTWDWLKTVYILPLRNENPLERVKKCLKNCVYILPLRNENSSSSIAFSGV